MSAAPHLLATVAAAWIVAGCADEAKRPRRDWSNIDYTARQDNDSAYTQPRSVGFCGLMHDFRCE